MLSACGRAHGPPFISAQLNQLWHALRAEVFAPAAEGLLPPEISAIEEVAAAAAACLTALLQVSLRVRQRGWEGVEVGSAGGGGGVTY
jgi:hypothetical protein